MRVPHPPESLLSELSYDNTFVSFYFLRKWTLVGDLVCERLTVRRRTHLGELSFFSKFR